MRFGNDVENVDRFALDIDPEQPVGRVIIMRAFTELVQRKVKAHRFR